MKALHSGYLDDKSERTLKEVLLNQAVKRIEVVRLAWSNLVSKDGRGTFVSYWATGCVVGKLPKEAFGKFSNDWWQGLRGTPILRAADIPGPILLSVQKLVDDAVTYVRWTLERPAYIQIVRAVERGRFVGDLSWSP